MRTRVHIADNEPHSVEQMGVMQEAMHTYGPAVASSPVEQTQLKSLIQSQFLGV